MFSVHPQYYYDNDDFYRALAAQRARERREAEYRARLQEARYKQQYQDALRRQAYQDYLAREQRRRSMYPFISGFDSDEEYSDAPYSSYVEPTHEPRGRFQSRDFPYGPKRQQMANAEQELRKTTPPLNHRDYTKVFPERPVGSTYQHSHPSHPTTGRSSELPQRTRPLSPRSPPRFDPKKDQAARKIQSFFRANLPRYKSLKAISSVAREFEKVVGNFTFPSVLDFADSGSDTVNLLYTSRNAPVHLHEHTLLNFLSRLDSIESHGDERVRVERKNLVKRIERELEKLDTRKTETWEAFRASSTKKDEPEPTPEPDLAVMDTADQNGVEMDCPSLSEPSPSDIITSVENMSSEVSEEQMPVDDTTHNQESPAVVERVEEQNDTTHQESPAVIERVEEQIDIDKHLEHDVVPGSDSMHPDSDDVLSTWEVVPVVDASDAPDGAEVKQQQTEVDCADEEMVEEH